MSEFFNFRVESGEGYWESVGFLRKWWRIYADDGRWAPPAWASLRQALVSKRFAHLQRGRPRLIALEALPRRRSQASGQPLSTFGHGALMEQPVAAAVALLDPRRTDGAAHLALPHVANNRESLERLLYAVQEQLAHEGIRRLILPVGLSPYLGTGVLQDHFHRVPPLYAPYAPPYVPELFTTVCRPLGRSLLFALEPGSHAAAAPPTSGPAKIHPLDPNRLGADLLPLFSRTVPSWAGFPPPDELEVEFLLRWILHLPALAWVAEIDGQSVGYLLTQPDGSELLRRSRGGRSLLGRLQLRILELRQPHSVRVLFMGVDPEHRRRGIGRQLWQQMMAAGPVNGWQSVTVGPLPSTAGDGINFLTALGLASRETYLLHRYDFD
ncbi:MAG: GNAT family N-acetyltransferase [Caldilineaceae bacterium]|nr:GNAT family N-acetyltransferase [Caldilineaceae bacterium]MCY4092048.1 GNAT family N-acetyltransferase [Caldilineaceae bacterium]MCY4118109.1 GNAT family N-acetyltransferase [Caldilineaceae bacterium]MDE0072081.1 GNAT family N-acetyltransferase [Caldilineaceae bacterium]MDE0183072.1 GNAT family N-acetyltransferase [Caldilineaceae bacterium]